MASRSIEDIEERARNGYADPEDMLSVISSLYKFMEPKATFQDKVMTWMKACFKQTTIANEQERCDRFLEEALELLQSLGYPEDRIAPLVRYVYDRPIGQVHTEIGGTMVTLAALCGNIGENMHRAGDDELKRINTPEMIDRLRAKDAANTDGSSLPGIID